jgi:ribosomal protein S18 acetylase RimI-like enzyme
MLDYEMTHHWNEGSSSIVIDGLKTFNIPFMGVDHPRKLSIIVRDESGKVVGGVLAETKWDWLHIAWLWIEEPYRAQGVGRRLMEDAEREGLAMGCHTAHLSTLDFQAKAFYEKLGYEVFAALGDYPKGHTRFMLKKKLRRP